MLGVAGTLLAFLRKLVDWQRCTGLSSLRRALDSSRTSFSVLPVYLNFVPHENKEPPLITGASEDLDKLKSWASLDYSNKFQLLHDNSTNFVTKCNLQNYISSKRVHNLYLYLVASLFSVGVLSIPSQTRIYLEEKFQRVKYCSV